MLPMDDLQQPSVGTLLKNRRNELGLSLADIAARTNIRVAYLNALEEDRYEALLGEAYHSGFLRSYAGVLGLEARSVLQQWRNETAGVAGGKPGEASVAPQLPSGGAPPRRLPSRALFLLLPLLLLPAIVFYFFLSGRHEVEMQMPALSTQALTQPEEQFVSSLPGEGPLPLPESAAETEVVAEKPDPPAPGLQPVLPVIPAEGGVVKLEAMGPLAVEVEVDSRPPQRYVLNTASALQWDVGRSARLAVDNPTAVKIWLGGEPLDLAGRSEIFLQAANPE